MSSGSMKPLILHGGVASRGPNPPKVAIAMEILSIPYVICSWSYGSDDQTGIAGSRYLAINPNGRLPSLQDPITEVTSWESSACLDYLARVYDPKRLNLGPAPSWTLQQRVDYDTWTSLLISTMGPMTDQLYWFLGIINKDDANMKAAGRYQAQVHLVLGVLEGQLEKHQRETVLSTGFSAVDIHWYCWVNAAQFANLDIAIYPLISNWHKAVQGKDEVQRAYERIQISDKISIKE